MSTTTTAGVTRVGIVVIPVADQDAMLDFYTEKLGLEKRADVPMGEAGGMRWIEVAPAGSEATIAIAPPPPGGSAGGRETGIILHTRDIDSYHARLQAAGVDVDAQVSRMGDPVPPLVWLRDPEGNVLMVAEVSDR